WQVLLSVGLHLLLLGFGLYVLFTGQRGATIGAKELLAYGILFYLGTLFLVSNIVFPIGTNMAERFLFMPSVGFGLVLAVAIWELVSRLNMPPVWRNTLLLSGVFALLYAGKTISRNAVWTDNFTLFQTDIAVAPNSAKLRNSAGGSLVARYKDEPNEQLRQEKLNEAVGHLQEAVR
ncbi:MAG: hypothetical protein AAFO94_23340, partial [Bacteroidota bacterium]